MIAFSSSNKAQKQLSNSVMPHCSMVEVNHHLISACVALKSDETCRHLPQARQHCKSCPTCSLQAFSRHDCLPGCFFRPGHACPVGQKARRSTNGTLRQQGQSPGVSYPHGCSSSDIVGILRENPKGCIGRISWKQGSDWMAGMHSGISLRCNIGLLQPFGAQIWRRDP